MALFGMALLLGATGAAAAAEPIKIGLAAMISPKETLRYYQGLLDYVGRAIGQPVAMIQKPTYDDMDVALEKGEINIAFVCAGPYVKDKDRFGVELLVAPQSNGQAFYHAYIIVPKDSPARSWADLGGRSFAFTDPKSNTGALVPRYMVWKKFGKTPEQFFSRTTFTGSHDRSIEAVAKKVVDGASVDSLIFDFHAKTNPVYTDLIRIIDKSPPYGMPPVVVNKGIDPALKARLAAAFLDMHKYPEGKAILDKIAVDRFIVPLDRDYNSVRDMEKELKSLQ
jgi:phosphonate transport system substrate-binding protein